MSREFSVRVSEPLARWVRRCGSATEVIGKIATAAHRGLVDVDVPDPGPGPERLTVRIPKPALPRIRELTYSRKNLVGLRKLILAGYQVNALPAPQPVPCALSEPEPKSLSYVERCRAMNVRLNERHHEWAMRRAYPDRFKPATGVMEASVRVSRLRFWSLMALVPLFFIGLPLLLSWIGKRGAVQAPVRLPVSPWKPASPTGLAGKVWG